MRRVARTADQSHTSYVLPGIKEYRILRLDLCKIWARDEAEPGSAVSGESCPLRMYSLFSLVYIILQSKWLIVPVPVPVPAPVRLDENM